MPTLERFQEYKPRPGTSLTGVDIIRPPRPDEHQEIVLGMWGMRVSGEGLPGDRPRGVETLLRRPISSIPDTQLTGMTKKEMRETMHIKKVREYDPAAISAKIATLAGTGITAVAIDMGGGKIEAQYLQPTAEGGLKQIEVEGVKPLDSKDGQGFLGYIKEKFQVIKNYAQIHGGDGADAIDVDNIAIGYSFGCPASGTTPEPDGYSNMQLVKPELEEQYGGDFANIIPSEHIDGDNDAITGLVAAANEALKVNPHVKKILYYIAGGGIGSAYIKDGKLYRVEQGHLEAVMELNPFGATKPCGQKVSDKPSAPCREQAGGSGVGIEELYSNYFGVRLTGKQIGERFRWGDPFAIALYDNAALNAATGILELDNASRDADEEALDPDETVVVCHGGGVFKEPGVEERMEQILEKKLGYAPKILYTKNFGNKNPCAVGAAMLALTKQDIATAA